MLKSKDLRQESVDELTAMAGDLQKDLFELKSELKVNRKIEKPHLIKEKRKDIARIYTIIAQKSREEKK